MKTNILVAAAGGLLLANLAGAASGPGTTAANVLNVGVGARAIGMGEAYTAVADDISSLYWNPAGMALLNQGAASFMYNQSFQDMNYNNASVGLSLENGGIGGGVSYLGFGKINGYDTVGNPTGDVDAHSAVATLGGGWLFDTWSLGFNTKILQGTLADEKATGAAFDLGTSFIYPEAVLGNSTLRVAATVRNLGPGMTYLEQKDPLPTEWRLGTSLMRMMNNKLNLSLDYGKARGNKGSVYAGGEFWLNPYMALRTGYSGADAEGSGLRAGLGLKVKNISFDYAYAGFGDLGLSHRYEMTWRFGDIRPLLGPEERRMLRQAKQAIRRQNFGEAVLLLDSLIRLVPNYKPIQRLYKVAAKGEEHQDKLAQGQRNFNVLSPMNKATTSSLSDLDDLEQLLKTSDQAMVQNTAPKAGGQKVTSKEQTR